MQRSHTNHGGQQKAPSKPSSVSAGLLSFIGQKFLMLIPNENETQPQFAIRFHEAMADQIADTSKRNKACFAAWDEHRGDDPTISELVESRFTPDQYQRLHNVAMFHEHTVPAQKIQDKEVPAQHYGRDELAEMVDGMNDRILDHDEFSPITRGHTGQKPGAKDGDRQMPEVLGFAGPYKLGMIGRKNPRWAIFGTEYHMKDAVPELKKRVGRSPEVWRYSRMRDRFFYPIATLGEEMPRLNLPPAHYSRRSADESPVFVECYSAVFPGGSNTFVPSFKASPDGRKPMADQYSADSPAHMQTPGSSGEGTKLGDMTLEQFLEVFMETQPQQFLLGLMRQAGQSGMPNPAIPNQIPPDPNAVAPGAPGQPAPGQDPAMGGQNPMAAGGGGAPAPMPPSSPADPMGQAPAAPPAPAAPAAGAPPFPPKPGMPPMDAKDKDNYSRQLRDVMDANAQLRKQLSDALAKIAEIDGEKTRIERYSRLEKLSSDYILKPEVELERTAGYSPEQFDAHVQIITDNYQRTLTNMPDYAALSDGVDVSSTGKGKAGPAKSENVIDPKSDLPKIEKYCIDHDVNYADAKEIYLRNNKSFPAKS